MTKFRNVDITRGRENKHTETVSRLTLVYTDPMDQDESTFCISIISEHAYTFGRTSERGVGKTCRVQDKALCDSLEEHHRLLEKRITSVIDMRSIVACIDRNYKEPFESFIDYRDRMTIRLWNSRTLQYVTFRAVKPEGYDFKDVQQKLSQWFHLGNGCFGYIKIGEPQDQ